MEVIMRRLVLLTLTLSLVLLWACHRENPTEPLAETEAVPSMSGAVTSGLLASVSCVTLEFAGPSWGFYKTRYESGYKIWTYDDKYFTIWNNPPWYLDTGTFSGYPATHHLRFERQDGQPFALKQLYVDGNHVLPGASLPITDNRLTSSEAAVKVLTSGYTTYNLPYPDQGWTGITYFDWTGGRDVLDHVQVCGPVYWIEVEIKPGDPNDVKLKKKGMLPVAILTTPEFDASTVDASTAYLGTTECAAKKNGSLMARLEDVDGDGDLDLMMQFDKKDLIDSGDLSVATAELMLTAYTFGGAPTVGADAVIVH
jgi:hypothetical protein